MKRKLKGFTLVELVITIAIVIILSVVSVPIYQGYTRKAKMAEGYALLGTILSAQKNYYSEYGNFLHSTKGSAGTKRFTCKEEVFNIDARGNKYFTCFNIGDGNDTTTGMHHLFYAYVIKPNELMDNDKSYIRMSYDITSGARIFEQKQLSYSLE